MSANSSTSGRNTNGGNTNENVIQDENVGNGQGFSASGQNMSTHASVTYKNQGNGSTSQSQSGNGAGGESGQEVVEEVGSVAPSTDTESSGQTTEAEESNNHMSVKNNPSAAPGSGPAGETGADSESSFESVPGWDESLLTEASGSAEPTIEASYASAGAESEEFFPALAALLLPLAKTVIPALAGAAVQQGTRTLSPRLQALLRRLSRLGITPAMLKGRESGGEYGEELTEAGLGELEQQLESLEVIIGTDDRVQVTNTASVPWSRVCQLKIKTSRGTYLGSGFFVGPRIIATAGHCVFVHGRNGTPGEWASEITVTPGRNGAATPFGTFTARHFRSVRGWVNGKSRNYDYGAILLPAGAPVPSAIGSFGFGYFLDSYLLNKHVNTAGYPGDKPPGTMWFHGRNITSVQPRYLVYPIDTMPGQSGSAVWVRQSDGKRIAVGIHTNGASTGNSATRITRPVFENLKRWRQEAGGTL